MMWFVQKWLGLDRPKALIFAARRRAYRTFQQTFKFSAFISVPTAPLTANVMLAGVSLALWLMFAGLVVAMGAAFDSYMQALVDGLPEVSDQAHTTTKQ